MGIRQGSEWGASGATDWPSPAAGLTDPNQQTQCCRRHVAPTQLNNYWLHSHHRVTYRGSFRGRISSRDTSMAGAHTTGLLSLGKHHSAHWVWRLPWSQMCWLGSWQCGESWLTPLPLAWSWFSASISMATGAPDFCCLSEKTPAGDLASHLCHSAHSWLFVHFFAYCFSWLTVCVYRRGEEPSLL